MGSPAAVNQDETLSTLRYANQAKMIVNKAVVNQDPTAALIKELRAEINKLRKQLSAHASAQSPQRAISRKSDADVADRGMRADVDGGGEAGAGASAAVASAADADADSGASAGAGAGAGTGAGAGAGAGGSDGEGAKFDGGSSADEGEDTEMATMEDALIARLKLLDKVGQTWDEKVRRGYAFGAGKGCVHSRWCLLLVLRGVDISWRLLMLPSVDGMRAFATLAEIHGGTLRVLARWFQLFVLMPPPHAMCRAQKVVPMPGELEPGPNCYREAGVFAAGGVECGWFIGGSMPCGSAEC